MALNLKLADAYVDISMTTRNFDDGYDRIMSKLKSAPSRVMVVVSLSTGLFDRQLASVQTRLNSIRAVPIRLSVDRLSADAALNLFRQNLSALNRQANQRVTISANLRPWQRAMVMVFTDLHRVRLMAGNIPITVNASPAHSNLNLLLQQLKAVQALTKLQITAQGAIGFGGLGGGGGFGGGNSRGRNFMTGVGMGLGLPFAMNPEMMAGNMAASATVGAVKTAADLESQFAELRRITGMTTDELGKFKQSLMETATTRPGIALQDLMDIALIGGRQGIADKGGVAAMAGFTEQLAKVKRAFTDIPTEELADRMIRVLNAFEMGTGDIQGFGSALAVLDKTSTATARDILDITNRLAGVGRRAGLTLPQVASLASVLKDVGVTNEVAGTTFTQVFRKMATESEEFAAQIGVNAKTFADAYLDSPMKALGMVIDKFKEMKNTIEGQKFLEGLGFEGARVGSTVQLLASKFAEVNPRAARAAGEQKSLGELSRAEAINSATTAAAFTQAKNSVTDLSDAVGEKLGPVTRALTLSFSDLASGMASVIRGNNRPSMAAVAKAAAAPAPPAPEPKVYKTAVEAFAATEDLRARTEKAEAEFNARDAEAKRLGFEARQAMAAARTPAAVAAATALSQKSGLADMRAKAAADAMAEATKEFRLAAQALDDLRRNPPARDVNDIAAERRDNLIFQGKSRLGNVLAAVAEARQGLLGIGMRGAASVASLIPQKEKAGSYATGLSGEDVANRIQEAILNGATDKSKKEEEIADNTAGAKQLLNEGVALWRRFVNQSHAAILGL